MVRFALRSLIVAAVALSLGVTAASAQDTRQNEPPANRFLQREARNLQNKVWPHGVL